MFRNRALLKFIIPVVLVLICLGIIALVSGFFGDESVSEDSSINSEVISEQATDANYVNDAQEAPILQEGGICIYEIYGQCSCSACMPEVNIIFEQNFIQLDPSDISRGNLILINNYHIFNPEYVGELALIADFVTPHFRVSNDEIVISEHIVEPLVRMFKTFYYAIGTNNVSVISGFRGLERQQEILDSNIERMGAAEARRWVAEPGHSEHHTGLAVDFGFYQYGTLVNFLGVGRTAWFRQNARYYGFIERYPESSTEITGVAHEPWHFRYIGLPHSYFITELGLVFEEYIDFLKQHCSEEPFIAEFKGIEYMIFFTGESEILMPIGSYFDISGTNTDGFVVTIRG